MTLWAVALVRAVAGPCRGSLSHHLIRKHLLGIMVSGFTDETAACYVEEGSSVRPWAMAAVARQPAWCSKMSAMARFAAFPTRK